MFAYQSFLGAGQIFDEHTTTLRVMRQTNQKITQGPSWQFSQPKTPDGIKIFIGAKKGFFGILDKNRNGSCETKGYRGDPQFEDSQKLKASRRKDTLRHLYVGAVYLMLVQTAM